jgi:paraquat-inducible protein A
MTTRPPLPKWAGGLMRHASFMLSWSMPEVMLLGILVALIKIAALATVIPGVGLYAMAALVILLAAIKLTFDPRQVWRRLEWQR